MTLNGTETPIQKVWKQCNFHPPKGCQEINYLDNGIEFRHEGKLYILTLKEKILIKQEQHLLSVSYLARTHNLTRGEATALKQFCESKKIYSKKNYDPVIIFNWWKNTQQALMREASERIKLDM